MELNVLLSFPESKYKNEILYNFSDDPNYIITTTSTIAESIDKVNNFEYDIILLDMNYSDGTGLDLKKKLNDIRDIPTIFVTDVNDDIQKVLALEYGADDYIVYPFNILELKARIRAIIRRVSKSQDETIVDQEKENIIVFDDFEFNIVGRKVTLKGEDIDLTGKEFDLLYILVSNSGKVYSRIDLAKEIWDENYEGHLRTVDVHIKRLREKIFDNDGLIIKTKWGKGYYYGNLEEGD
ncbi:response regulator transcription factor [Miniphocaeibacter halophilus]|uniref:Response regulator transcription factor n=1 Tax=Miniphocaeibacter halophilus TaxID=2931922 RepID=A0AC61MS29_9FIRM|nr:response regulator transcription factor [Miniphocaeibacter halophilus]QQK07664.1 response regulator transcription factor [Miniphocaeibacter halophilus]